MNLLLSRILTYLNGTLFNDYYYKIGKFIVSHYLEMENMSKEELMEEGPFKEIEIDSFVGSFGFDSYEDFQFRLYNDYQTRLNQIRLRLIGQTPQKFMKKMDMTMTEEELEENISSICEWFYNANRIIIIGALYPMSIGIELQTDMITFGKPFFQYHAYDHIELDENDVAIFVSGTGRSLDYFRKNKTDMNVEKAKSILITQSKKYNDQSNENTKVIVVPGKFESVEFNYQIMSIFDLLRLHYFQQYYL